MPDSLFSALALPGATLSLALGTAAWLRWGRSWRQKARLGRELNPADQIPDAELGQNYIILTNPPRQVVLGEHARFQHTQVIGSSGTGKTYYLMLPNMYQDIHRRAGVIAVDPKSNMREVLASYAVEAGRGHDFLHFDLADPSTSLSYSPLTGDDPAEIANRVWTAFYQDDRTPTPFYRESALSYCRNFFGICKHLGVLPTLAQLQACVSDQNTLEAFVSLAPRTDEGQFLKNRYLTIKSSEYVQLFEGFMNKLAPLATGPFAHLLNTTSPEIDIHRIVTQGQILCAGLAADRYPSDYKVVSTMMLMDLQSSLSYRYGRDVRPMFLYMDEFGDLIYPKARDLIAKAREAKVGVTIAHQALGDLKSQGDSFADSIFASTSNKVIFRVGTADTAEQLAKLCGTQTVAKDLVNYALKGSGPLNGGKTAKGMTTVEGEEFLAHPNILKNLGVGEALMIIQRRGGRELHQGAMLRAPQVAPIPIQSLGRSIPARQYKPLVLKKSQFNAKAGSPGSTDASNTLNFLSGN